MRKKVLLLAVSCKNGGLCPGGLDLDDPSKWIRIVRDDGQAGAVQGCDIDFAKPLDVIEFEGRPMPQGKQIENWVIDNNSCRKTGYYRPEQTIEVLDWAYQQYAYKGFWGNYRAFLNEQEFNAVNVPSESIMRVSNVRIYKNQLDKAKIDFNCDNLRYPIRGISMTDQDFYDRIQRGDVNFDNAYIITSIPKAIDDWVNTNTGEKQAYKFVSKIFQI
ncbi:MAG: hypothetical protein LBG80_03030 [Bacteroidales bacterium]|jgi:hypothetical protein|nr:hypothetical protein [Bacteroidales bacterium]